MKHHEKVRFSIRTKRIVGTIGIFPIILIIPIIFVVAKKFTIGPRLGSGIYMLTSLAYVFLTIALVQRSLKRKHQGEKAGGWLNRLIYTLDDTYERWSGRQ